jgi:hypothetical protein
LDGSVVYDIYDQHGKSEVVRNNYFFRDLTMTTPDPVSLVLELYPGELRKKLWTALFRAYMSGSVPESFLILPRDRYRLTYEGLSNSVIYSLSSLNTTFSGFTSPWELRDREDIKVELISMGPLKLNLMPLHDQDRHSRCPVKSDCIQEGDCKNCQFKYITNEWREKFQSPDTVLTGGCDND